MLTEFGLAGYQKLAFKTACFFRAKSFVCTYPVVDNSTFRSVCFDRLLITGHCTCVFNINTKLNNLNELCCIFIYNNFILTSPCALHDHPGHLANNVPVLLLGC